MMHTSLSPPASFHALDPDVLSTVNASCPNLHAAITSLLQFLSCFFFQVLSETPATSMAQEHV